MLYSATENRTKREDDASDRGKTADSVHETSITSYTRANSEFLERIMRFPMTCGMAVLPSKLDNIGGETLLVLTTARDLALCRAMLPERRTGATLGHMQLRSHLLNAGTATRGA